MKVQRARAEERREPPDESLASVSEEVVVVLDSIPRGVVSVRNIDLSK